MSNYEKKQKINLLSYEELVNIFVFSTQDEFEFWFKDDDVALYFMENKKEKCKNLTFDEITAIFQKIYENY